MRIHKQKQFDQSTILGAVTDGDTGMVHRKPFPQSDKIIFLFQMSMTLKDQNRVKLNLKKPAH